MQVSRWGNSLAIRIPAKIVEMLELKEGDEIEITIKGRRSLETDRDRTRADALATLRASNWVLPKGWKFDREEANER